MSYKLLFNPFLQGNFQFVNTSSGGSTVVYTETPTGLINGSNVTYTINHEIGSILNFTINDAYIDTDQYNFSGNTITFNIPLDASLSGTPFEIVYIADTGSTFVAGGTIADNILSTTTGINALNTGTTALYTIPAGQSAVITGAVVRVTAASGVVGVPTLGIGIAPGEDDIFSPTILTGMTSTSKVFRFASIGTFAQGSAGNIIKVGIDSAGSASSLTISIDLIGYLIS